MHACTCALVLRSVPARHLRAAFVCAGTLGALAAAPRVRSAAGSAGSASGSEATFALAGEDHTLGNALRYMLNRQPVVAFAGYSVPHPSDDLVNVRVQTTGAVTATQALRDAVTGAWRREHAAHACAKTLAPGVGGLARSRALPRGRRLGQRVRAREHDVRRRDEARQSRQRRQRHDGGVTPVQPPPWLQQRAPCSGLRARALACVMQVAPCADVGLLHCSAYSRS